MRQLLLVFLCAISLVSCNNETKASGSVKLEILNKELFFNKDITRPNYYSDSDRERARNIVTWKITNNSANDYLFIINEDGLYGDPTQDVVAGHIRIIDKAKNEKQGSMSAVSWAQRPGCLFNCERYSDSTGRALDSLKGFKHFRSNNYYRKNAIVLHSGESRTYKSIVSLPILEEGNVLTWQHPISIFGLKDGDKLSIIYDWDAKEIESYLEKYQLEELKHNTSIIYNGRLESNRVPLKGR